MYFQITVKQFLSGRLQLSVYVDRINVLILYSINLIRCGSVNNQAIDYLSLIFFA